MWVTNSGFTTVPAHPKLHPIKISSKNSETNSCITIKQIDLLDSADCVRVVRTIVFTAFLYEWFIESSRANGSIHPPWAAVAPHPLPTNPAKKCVYDGNLIYFMRIRPPTLLNIYCDVHRGWFAISNHTTRNYPQENKMIMIALFTPSLRVLFWVFGRHNRKYTDKR